MKISHVLFLFMVIGICNINAQVSKTNNTPITLANGPGHVDRTFVFAAGEFGTCTSLTDVTLSLQLSIGNGTPCSGGGYGVHEDLNVRLVSPTGTTVDLVQDRWGYWTGNSSQSHSFNGFTVVDATINFNDSNTPNIQTLNDWTAGSYAPHDPLSAFNGQNPVGTWTLRISDGNSQFAANDFYCFVTGTLTVTCGIIVPVELVDFYGIQRDKNVTLSWETASESNNQGFEIQHSVDGEKWNKIGFKEGEESTAQFYKYEFIHDLPKNGANYYRLKQLDNNGKFEYSPIINVPISNNDISISPNPTTDFIRLNNFSGGKIKIYDTSGRIVKEEFISGEEVNMSNFPKGVYFIQILSEHELFSWRILKQ